MNKKTTKTYTRETFYFTPSEQVICRYCRKLVKDLADHIECSLRNNT